MQCSPSVTLTWHISLRLVVPGSEVAAGSRGEWGEGSCWGRLETGVRVRGARCTLQCPLQVRHRETRKRAFQGEASACARVLGQMEQVSRECRRWLSM